MKKGFSVDMSSKFNGKNNNETPKRVQYLQAMQAEEADLYVLNKVESEVQGVLGALQRIAELVKTNKKKPAVEDLHQKILAEYKKIQAYLSPDKDASNQQNLENNKQSVGGIELEKNPLIQEMGGMPLEVVSPEWRELTDEKFLDKAELENLVNKKLKERVDLANKLKAKNKLKQAPKLSAPSPALTPKYQQKIQNTLKYILKEIPAPAPAFTPAPRLAPSSAPKLRPHGGGN